MRERHGLFHNSLVFILVFLLGVTVIVVPRWGLSVRTFDACFYCCCYCVFRGSVQEEKELVSHHLPSLVMHCRVVLFVSFCLSLQTEVKNGRAANFRIVFISTAFNSYPLLIPGFDGVGLKVWMDGCVYNLYRIRHLHLKLCFCCGYLFSVGRAGHATGFGSNLILIDCSNSYSRFVRLIPGFTSAIQCVPFHLCMRRRAVLRDLQQGFGCGWEEAHPHKAWLILENVRCGVGNEVLMTAFIFGPLACGLHWH
jgi:hypothetical protein